MRAFRIEQLKLYDELRRIKDRLEEEEVLQKDLMPLVKRIDGLEKTGDERGGGFLCLAWRVWIRQRES